ncbi:AAA family ATPase [Companilactobacillus sp. FL22-1]|uniref:AAA family ATPase n=1 Tax=Companilactobacillus sp. FL22-1 TaxID=3373892 RepID=UPI0037543269
MKPIYLEIDNFGPHAHSTIDFRKLDESPIFLIGGDTGAGKSTIFDAMTYALFNTTTSDRDAKEMRSQFAGDKDVTKVIFYFEQNGKIYKVERTPEQYLAKKVGSGTTKKNPTANLSVVEDVNQVEIESIASKPVDVGHAITEILNLSADQFKKIILLPQNDFSEFLKSNTDEKEKILKKIFGTQLFTDFVAKLKDHYLEANQKSAEFNNELKSQIESPVWSETEQDELSSLPNDQLESALKRYTAARKEHLATTQAFEKKVDNDWQNADKKYHDAKITNTNFDKLAESEQEYQTNITQQATAIKDKKDHVIELTWAQGLQDIVRDLDRTKQETQETTQSKQTTTKALKDAQSELQQVKENFEQLNSQTKEYDKKNQQAQKLDVTIAQVRDVEKIKSEITRLAPQIKQAQQKHAEQVTAVEATKQKITTKQTEAIDTTQLTDKKDQLTHEREKLIEILTPLENKRDSAISETQKLQEKLKKLTAEAEKKQATLDKAKANYQEKIKTRQTLMIAQLRQELEDGEACAVCGSTEHPYANQKITANETELRQSMDEVDNSQKTYAAADNAVKEANQTLDELSEEFSQKQAESVTALRNLSSKYNELLETIEIDLPVEFDLDKIKQQFQTKLETIDQKIKTAQKLAQEIKNLQQELQDLQTKSVTANTELERLTAQKDTRQKDLDEKLQQLDDPEVTSDALAKQQQVLKKAYNDFQVQLKDTQSSLNTAERVASNKQTQLKDIEVRLNKEQTTIDTLTKELEASLNATSAKTHELAILQEWIAELADDNLSHLQSSIASYNKEKELLTKNIQQLKQTLTGLTKPNIEELKQKATDLQIQKNTAIAQLTKAETNFNNAQAGYQKVQKIMQEQGNFAKELAGITSLYNIVSGKDGNDSKLKLETYVVQNYLRTILSYANQTFLNRLSHNRYSFVISEEARNKQRDHGLDINVYDRETNAIRSSDTLSGGETFIAALSIALSLSEVVQSSANGVQIDALFVDEGFGSLDDETLSEAMAALEDIGQNRIVGVISHIESMKQSIGQQLLVKKLGDGKSKIELINK